MQVTEKRIDHGTLRRLLHSGVEIGAEVVGSTGGWGVFIHCGSSTQQLAAARGEPRVFRKFETLAAYLKGLGITDLRVRTAEYEPDAGRADDRRSATASRRMLAAHQAAAYAKWFREQVQAAIDDPRPSVSDDKVRREFAAKREALRKRSKAPH
jgi:hypothetical protein